MADDLKVAIKVTLDGQQAIGETNAVATALDKVGDNAETAAPSIDRMVDAATPFGKVALGFNEVAEAFGRLGGYVGDAAALADKFAGLTSRLKLAVGEGAAFADAFEQVRAIANSTGSDIDATAALFGKLTQATKDLGVSQGDVARMTETINQAFIVSGASAVEWSNAIRQLAQGLSAGALRGDEFNSVMEQAPRLSQALADSLGVSTGELRALAAEGKLTAEVISTALAGQADAIAADFERMSRTIGQAMQAAQNEFLIFVGELDKAQGVSAGVAGAIDGLAKHIDSLGQVALSVGAVAFAGMAAKIAAAFAESALEVRKSIVDMQAKRAADLQAAQAAEVYAAAEKSSAVATMDAARARQAAAQAALIEAQATLKAAADVGLYGNQRAAAERAVTSARVQLTEATVALTAAERANMLATGQLTAAKTAATVQAGLLGTAMRALSLPVNIMLAVAGFEALTAAGKWLGESIAKLVHGPLPDTDNELKKVNAAAQGTAGSLDAVTTAAGATAAAVGAIGQAASGATNKLVEGFNAALADAKVKGEGAQVALEKMVKAASFDTPAGIKELALALEDAGVKAAVSGQAIDKELRERIAKLTAEELARFGVTAQAAFESVGAGAQASGRIVDATLAESFRRLGVDTERMAAGVGKDFSDLSIIFNGVAESAKSTGPQLVAAFEGLLDKAKTKEEFAQLETVFQSLKQSGKLSADEIAQAFSAMTAKVADAGNQMNSALGDALDRLKIKSVDQTRAIAASVALDFGKIADASRSGAVSVDQLGSAFEQYARAALAANNGVVSATLKAQAAATGMTETLGKLADANNTAEKAAHENTLAIEQQGKIAELGINADIRAADAKIRGAEAALQKARASGDEAAASEALNALADAEIEKADAVARQKQVVADAALAKVAALRQEAEADGLVTQAEALAIAQAQDYANSTYYEAQAATQAADAIRDKAAALRDEAAAKEEANRWPADRIARNSEGEIVQQQGPALAEVDTEQLQRAADGLSANFFGTPLVIDPAAAQAELDRRDEALRKTREEREERRAMQAEQSAAETQRQLQAQQALREEQTQRRANAGTTAAGTTAGSSGFGGTQASASPQSAGFGGAPSAASIAQAVLAAQSAVGFGRTAAATQNIRIDLRTPEGGRAEFYAAERTDAEALIRALERAGEVTRRS